jgi:poly(ADP-ribose) glycohydrolase
VLILLPIAASVGLYNSNWGCGAFGGFLELKAVIQLLAAAQANRSLQYYTFGETELIESLPELYQILCDKQCTVGT